MGKKKKIIITIVSIILIIALVVSIIAIAIYKKSNDIILYDNVKIITQNDTDKIPSEVKEKELVFDNNQNFSNGDVIVAGILPTSPNGFIRKVISTDTKNGKYVVKTSYACLTDVFKKAKIYETFAVTENEVKNIESINNGVMNVSLSNNLNNSFTQLAINNEEDTNTNSNIEIKPSENGLGLVVNITDEVGKNLQLSGQIELTTYIEAKIEIDNGNIDFGLATHTDTNGSLFVGIKKQLFNKNDTDKFNGEYKKDLFNTSLPNFEFVVGTVPIVITNDFELFAAISTQLEGQIGTTVGISSERTSGFEYSSETGNIKEINERKYLSDGLEWKTETKANGNFEAGIYAGIVTKLYGSTGTALSLGIVGDVNGEAGLGVNENLIPTLYGELSLSVSPKISGKIVVSFPVVDHNLIEAELFKIKLPAFWEKKFSVPDPMLIAMKKGNFSCFAGTYIATPEAVNSYGGGDDIQPLILNKDGSLSGGGFSYMKNVYPNSKPISVEKKEDGTYVCTLSKNTYYTIYPKGTIKDNAYTLKNQSYLKNVVYINCFVYDGGAIDIDYYSDSIKDVITDYDGDDWVSIKKFKYDKVGQQFISGTGIKYKVIGIENNFDKGGGRIKVILESNDKKQWIVSNIPAYLTDTRTKIDYYNIYKYNNGSNQT